MATDGNDINQIYYPSHMLPKITIYHQIYSYNFRQKPLYLFLRWNLLHGLYAAIGDVFVIGFIGYDSLLKATNSMT